MHPMIIPNVPVKNKIRALEPNFLITFKSLYPDNPIKFILYPIQHSYLSYFPTISLYYVPVKLDFTFPIYFLGLLIKY